MRRGRFLAAAIVIAAMGVVTAAAIAADTPPQLFDQNAIDQGYGGVTTPVPPVTTTVTTPATTVTVTTPGTTSVAGTTTAVTTTAPTTTTTPGGVAGTETTQTTATPGPTQAVAGANKTVQKTPAPAGVAPAAHVSGTLPFTGLQLAVFVLLGLGLLTGGLLIRRVGRSES